MNKFKVGDIVTCIDARFSMYLKVGNQYKIYGVDKQSEWVSITIDRGDGTKGIFWYNSRHFELYQEKNMNKFKVGDTVVCVRTGASVYLKLHNKYEVVALDNDGIYVVINFCGDRYWYNENHFELYKESEMSLQDNINRMKQELAIMEAKLKEEQNRKPYIGDQNFAIVLNGNELAQLMATFGKSPSEQDKAALKSNPITSRALENKQIKELESTSGIYLRLENLLMGSLRSNQL